LQPPRLGGTNGRRDRISFKIVSAGEDVARRSAGPAKVDRHDGVDGFAFARVIFTHPDPAQPSFVKHTIRETVLTAATASSPSAA
jgi:hypothetical protein